MKTQIQIIGIAAEQTIATFVKNATGKDTGYFTNEQLLNFDEIGYHTRYVTDMDSTEELLDLEWFGGKTPDMHVTYIQHVYFNFLSENARMLFILTSSGNKTIIRLDYETDERIEDSYVHIAFKGARGRFVEDLRTYAGIIDSSIIQGSNVKNIEGANVMAPDYYETTGPGDMLPWEVQGQYIIRLHEEGNRQVLFETIRRIYSKELTWQAEPTKTANEEHLCNYYMGNVEDGAANIESILDIRHALQQAIDKI